MDFNSLPEDCITTILSFTTPRDVCRTLAVSPSVKSAANSNVTWEKFLPPDYEQLLISSSVSPVQFASKKELYFRLCDSILIENGKKMFWLERSTGKKCYMLSATNLSITWGDYSMYWCWKPMAQSRFPEVVELRCIDWLEIHGKIRSELLSPNTKYAAYLVVKYGTRPYGLNSIPAEILVEVGNEYSSKGTALLSCKENDKDYEMLEGLLYSNRRRLMMRESVKIVGDERVPSVRKDGWMEIELGDFFINHGDEGDEVRMSLMEVRGVQLKGGLIVEGIEVRPKE